jgi:hypothetical protein
MANGLRLLQFTDEELIVIQDAVDDALDCDVEALRTHLQWKVRLALRLHRLTGEELPPHLTEASK